jgi:hypothetical protein
MQDALVVCLAFCMSASEAEGLLEGQKCEVMLHTEHVTRCDASST